MAELFNYDTSWLNPALKLINSGLFVVVAVVYYRARRYYAGDIHKILSILFWMGIAAAVAAFLRYLGHGTDFGFTKEYSLKWFQSLGYVIQSILFVAAAREFAKGVLPELRNLE
jgi:hypothetical protein